MPVSTLKERAGCDRRMHVLESEIARRLEVLAMLARWALPLRELVDDFSRPGAPGW
jgi:hypothetical protein